MGGCQLPKDYQDISSYIKDLCDFIQQYQFLIDIHVVDFISHNQWFLLDPEWQHAFLPDHNQDPDWWNHLIHISTAADLTNNFEMDSTWPTSLCRYIEKIRSLTLPRQTSLDDDLVCMIDRHIKPGMTQKKLHEVERMGPLIDKVAKDNHIGHVIDLGAGQGYLSRTMAFQYDLQVMAIDGSEVQTCGAKRFDTMAIKGFKDKEHLIHHVTDLFTPENATDILQSLQQQHTHPSLLICGLHACGDLSTMMLRLFTQQSDIQALVNVGCCYHFLSHQGPSPGFPMSRTLQSFQLGSTACMLACQAPSRWLDQKEASIKAYEHHFFRCLLQWMMIEKGLISATDKAPIIGRLNKKRDFDSFPIYVKAALTRLGMDPNAISSDDAAAQYHHYKHTAQVDKRIAVLWTLRALLGPVIESFILMDRYMYLEETVPPSPTKSVSILPLFDDLVSPRNMVIVATK